MGDLKLKYQKLFDVCAKDDRIALSQLIVSEGLNPTAYDATTDQEKTPLHIAASHGSLDVVQTLVEVYGCNPNALDGIGSKPVHDACVFGHLRSVDYLLHVGIENNNTSIRQSLTESDWKGNTLLHKACQSGSIALTRYITHAFLIPDHSFKLNLFKDDLFCYVISKTGPYCHLLKRSQDSEYCTFKEYLLKINKVNDTPLHTACRHGHLNVLKYFIQMCILCGLEDELRALIPSLKMLSCQINALPIVHFFCTALLMQTLEPAVPKRNQIHLNASKSCDRYAMCRHSKCNPVLVVDDKTHYVHRKSDFCLNETEIELLSAIRSGSLERIQYLAKYVKMQYEKYYPMDLERHTARHDLLMTELQDNRLSANYGTFKYGHRRLLSQSRPRESDSEDFPVITCTKLEKQLICKSRVDGQLSIVKALNKTTEGNELTYSNEDFKCIYSKALSHARFTGGVLLSASHFGNQELVKYASEILKNCDEAQYKVCLHGACVLDNVQLIEYLLQIRNKCTNLSNETGDDCLHTACKWGSLNTVKYLIEMKGFKPHTCNKVNETPLHVAVKHQRLDLCTFLLGVMEPQYLSLQNSKTKETLFHLLASADSHKSQMFIDSFESIKLTFDLDIADEYGDSPLFNACHSGNVEMVTFLIQRGCNPLYVNKFTKETPIHVVCRMQRHDILQNLLCLIQGGISSCNLLNETPLSLALSGDSTDLVQSLLDSEHCNVNQKLMFYTTIFFSSPLHFACNKGLEKVVKILLSRSASCDIQTKQGNTALHIACSRHSLPIVEMLVEHSSVTKQNLDGNTPLHLVCNNQWLDALHCMLKQHSGSLDSYVNNEGNTVLHVACKVQNLAIVKLLLPHCSISVLNLNGNAPIHIACQEKNFSLVEYMVNNCSPSVRLGLDTIVTNTKDTILHISAENGSLNIVKLLKEHQCCARKVNERDDTPIHLACRLNHNFIVEYLINSSMEGEILYSNTNGETFLHIACANGNADIVKFLVQKGFQFQKTNDGDTPFHSACCNGRKDIAQYIVTLDEPLCDIYQLNKKGESGLYCALKCHHIDLVNMFIVNNYCDPNKVYYKDEMNELPLLHFLAMAPCILLSTLKEGSKCDVSISDGKGNNILHYVCQLNQNTRCQLSLASEILPYLTSVKDFDLNATNQQGDTVLHLACKLTHDVRRPNPRYMYMGYMEDHYWSSEDHSAIGFIQNLVSTGKVTSSLSLKNSQHKTPVQLTNNYSVIRLLISYGANPKDVYDVFASVLEKYKLKQPLEQFSKLVVIGNSSAGKTTLIAALKASEAGEITDIVQCVTGPTAGIVQSHHVSKCYGRVVFHDFAGQPEFESTNSVFLETQCSSPLVPPPIFLLLVDVRERQSIDRNVLYWLTFIENHCSSQAGAMPHVIVVGSHADLLPSVKEHKSMIHGIVQKFKSSSVCCFGPILLDCRKPGTDEIKSLQSLLKDSCRSLNKSIELDCRCHMLFAHLLEWFSNQSAVLLREVRQKIQLSHRDSDEHIVPITYRSHNYNSDIILLPVTCDALLSILDSLHTAGHILLLKGADNVGDYWIVMDQDSVFSDVNGTLFAPDNFPQHLELDNNTGVFSSVRIKELFPKLDPNMVQQFLVYSEFCQRITDIETLNLISLGSDHNPDIADSELEAKISKQEYLFFPGLVKSEKPANVWAALSYQIIGYQCGWVLQCKPGTFLETRFLHVLLLRLTFSFVSASSTSESGESTLNRKCDIWKNGIHWSTRNGVEVLVEVVEQNTAVVALFRCWERQEMEAIKLRSAVCDKIIATKQQFCSRVEHDEYLIHPHSLSCGSNHNTINSYCRIHITEIAQAVSEGLPCIIDSNNKSVPLDSLLYFEPYSRLGKKHIALLFAEENSTKDIPQETLYDLADLLHPVHKQVTQVLKVPQRESFIHMKTWKENPTILLHQIFESWKSRQASSTYEALRQQFDEYSIFFGRNPLEMCGMPTHNM